MAILPDLLFRDKCSTIILTKIDDMLTLCKKSFILDEIHTFRLVFR